VGDNATVVDDTNGEVRELDFPFTVSLSGGGLFVLQMEERRNAYAILIGYTPSLEAADRRECVALITVRGVLQSVYGYPNEEAYWHDPRGEIGTRVVEIVGSTWADEIDSYNERTFGTPYPWSRQRRHFFLGSKDASVQFLATDIEIDLFAEPLGSAFEQARQVALTRLDTYPEP
jgi:hypothetical protein